MRRMSPDRIIARILVVLGLACASVAPTFGQANDQRNEPGPLPDPGPLEPIDLCRDPPLRTGVIQLHRAEANFPLASHPPDRAPSSIKLSGCFGHNASGELVAGLRLTYGTRSGQTLRPFLETGPVIWNGAVATILVPDFPRYHHGAFDVAIFKTIPGQLRGQRLTPFVPLTYLSIDRDGDRSIGMEFGGDDCDDSDPDRFPGNQERVDAAGHDEDCDYSTFGERDLDQDGFHDSRACNRLPDGSAICGRDCNDTDISIHPLQIDILNGRDDNCNGEIDEHQPRELLLELLQGN